MDDKNIQILIKAARAGGVVLKEFFNKTLNPIEKSSLCDFKTEADLGSEKAILDILKSEFPTYNFFSEEEGEINNGSEYTVVVDPLDGTNNFVIGIPNFTVSIAIIYKEEAIYAVVYQPILDQMYFAIKNSGAFLNSERIKVNSVNDPVKMTVSYGCGYNINNVSDYQAKVFYSLFTNDKKRITNQWSPANEHCLLACGKTESIIADGIDLHDFGAGKLIALEAGAKIIDFSGNPDDNYLNGKYIISNSDEINKHVLSIIQPLQKGRKQV